VFVSAEPGGPQLYVSAGGVLAGGMVPTEAASLDVEVVQAQLCSLALVSARGVERMATVSGPSWRESFPLPPRSALYVRAELLDAAGDVLALSNPIYFD
jgi:hypothetical protein